jgi:hypothetical protein
MFTRKASPKAAAPGPSPAPATGPVKGPATATTAASGAGEALDGVKISGYLLKKKVKSGSINWKRRYFVLNDHTLVYFESNKNTDSPLGDILIQSNTLVEVAEQQGHPFCLLLSSPSIKTVYLAASSAEERDAWHEKLRETISHSDRTVRGYLLKKGALSGWTEKYYILQEDGLTCHDSHLLTSKIVSTIPIKAHSTIEYNQPMLTFHITTTGEEPKKGTTLKCQNQEEWIKWSNYMTKRLTDLRGDTGSSTEGGAATAGAGASTEVIRLGYLETRPTDGGDNWTPAFYTLTAQSLTQFEDEKMAEAQQVFTFNVNCTVFETNLRPYSFQLVTSGKVFHAQGQS